MLPDRILVIAEKVGHVRHGYAPLQQDARKGVPEPVRCRLLIERPGQPEYPLQRGAATCSSLSPDAGIRRRRKARSRAPWRAVTILDIHGGGLSYVIDPGYKIAKVEFGWDWATGEFIYASSVKFHQALFLLLGRRRLAKVCPQCSACFLAKRGTQLYCSTDCSEIAEREWKREWWRENGDAWRAKRNRKSQANEQTRRGRIGSRGPYVM